MIQPALVKDIIKQLELLPPDLPCFIRLKYSSNTTTDEVPLNKHGISLMETNGTIDKVVFLS